MLARGLGDEVESHRRGVGHGLVEVPGDLGEHPEVLVQGDMDLVVVSAQAVGHFARLTVLAHLVEAHREGLDRVEAHRPTALLHERDGDGAVDAAAEEGADGNVGDEMVLDGVLEDLSDLCQQGGFVVDALTLEGVGPVGLDR